MYQVASGSGMAVGLVGADGPPLSPETIGRAPSIFEAPVPIRSLSELTGVETPIVPVPAPAPVVAPVAEAAAPETDVRRLVVRLLGGEEIELGSFDDREDAVEAARELIARFAAAEAEGEWPEVEGRFLRPGSVASIDVLVSE